MRKGILSLSLPGMRRPTPNRKPANMTYAEQQTVAATPAEPLPVEYPPVDEVPEPVAIEEPVPAARPKGPSMMKVLLKRHEEIAARVHKNQEQAAQEEQQP